ncbi:hypothetical protein CF328_g6340 [Tilletia controversa]|nr:hypothetical protein CF328_g6340 [Tilletia controversa]
MFADQAGGLATSQLSTNTQIALLDWKILVQEWYESYYKIHNENKKFDRIWPTPDEVWDHSDVPALCDRLTSFLSHKRRYTIGVQGLGMPAVASVQDWSALTIAVGEHPFRFECTLGDTQSSLIYRGPAVRISVQQTSSAANVSAELARVLRFNGTGDQGVYQRVQNLCTHLIAQYKLPIGVKSEVPWERLEVELILENMVQQMRIGGNREAILQRMLLVQICFTTGLRIGSLATGAVFLDGTGGFLTHDVSIIQPEAGKYELTLKVRTLKGWGGLDTSTINPRINAAA